MTRDFRAFTVSGGVFDMVAGIIGGGVSATVRLSFGKGVILPPIAMRMGSTRLGHPAARLERALLDAARERPCGFRWDDS